MHSRPFSRTKMTMLMAMLLPLALPAMTLADDEFRCPVDGCSITTTHSHGSRGGSSGAVNEYEAFRQWRERVGGKNSTHQDYLDWKANNGGRDYRSSREAHTGRRPAAQRPRSQPAPVDRRRARRPVSRTAPPRQVLRTGPLHTGCRVHFDDHADFSEFPCAVERRCKKCPTPILMYASSYEYDKYNRLEKIKYYPTSCPNCRYANKLTVRFSG